MLHLATLDAIRSLLLQVPGLVDALERREPDFADRVKAWMQATEQVLKDNRLPTAAAVAGLRATLISMERGVAPASLTISGRQNPRRIREAAAADLLRSAEQLVSGAIAADSARIAEAERLAGQIASVALRKELTAAARAAGSHTEAMMAVWSAVRADPDVGSAATHLAGLVGAQDALAVLDRALGDWKTSPSGA